MENRQCRVCQRLTLHFEVTNSCTEHSAFPRNTVKPVNGMSILSGAPKDLHPAPAPLRVRARHKNAGSRVVIEGVKQETTIHCVFCLKELQNILETLRGNYIDGYLKKKIERLVNGRLERFEITLPIIKVGRACVSCSPLFAYKCITCNTFYKHSQLCIKCGYATILAILPETDSKNITLNDPTFSGKADMWDTKSHLPAENTEKPIDPAWMTSRGQHRKF